MIEPFNAILPILQEEAEEKKLQSIKIVKNPP